MRVFVRFGFIVSFLFFCCTCDPVTFSIPLQKHPNIVLITIDTLRPDHLGCYGYNATKEKNISPNMDSLANDGVLFENCFVQCPITLPSHTSILTGLNPTRHNVRDNFYYALEPDFETLAEILKSNGYETAAIIGAEPLKKSVREGYGLSQGFDHYDDALPTQEEEFEIFFPERSADEVSNLAIHYVQKRGQKKEPFFLWLHYFDPHAPYNPPSIHNHFASPCGEAYKKYAGEVNFTDFEIGRVLKTLDLSNTLIVLTADHGEGLGEHDEESHGTFLFDSTLRVPLIFSWKGKLFPKKVTQQVRSIDIAPTVLDLCAIPSFSQKKNNMDGQSLSTVLQKQNQGKEPESYSETFYGFQNFNWKVQRCLRNPNYKYLEGLKNEPLLFDLKADAQENKPQKAEGDALAGMVSRLKSIVEEEEAYKKDLLKEWNEQFSGGTYWTIPPAPLDGSTVNPEAPLTKLLIQMNRALNLAEAGQYQESLQECDAILKQDPKNIAILNLKAKLLSSEHLKEYYQGAEIFRELRQLRPELIKVCTHGIIHNYIRLSKFESAKKEIEYLQERKEQDYQTYNFLAFLQLEEGAPEKALKTLELSYENKPHKNPICEYYRSQAYFRLGRFDEAIDTLNHCLSDNENFTLGFQAKEAYLRQMLKEGIEAISEKRFLDAELLFQKSLKLGDTVHARYYLALAFIQNKKKSAATELLMQLVEEHPDYYDAYFYLGFLHLEANRFHEGTEYLKTSITQFKNCYEDHRQETIALLTQLQKHLPQHELMNSWTELLNQFK